MKERIEDLGKLAILLDQLRSHEAFDILFEIRPKSFVNYFRTLTEEKQDDLLHKMIYGFQSLNEKLMQALEIAEGVDEFNYDPRTEK